MKVSAFIHKVKDISGGGTAEKALQGEGRCSLLTQITRKLHLLFDKFVTKCRNGRFGTRNVKDSNLEGWTFSNKSIN